MIIRGIIKAILLLLGYGLGLIQTGYIFGKTKKMDIRDYGSGNAGTTNAFRVMGAKAGFIVFLGDFLKSFIPCMLVLHIFRYQYGYKYLYTLYMGLGVILGHNYPPQNARHPRKPALCSHTATPAPAPAHPRLGGAAFARRRQSTPDG